MKKDHETKELLEKYLVNDCKTLEEFLDKYYKYDRYKGRGKDYAQSLLKSHLEDLEKYRIGWISKHESITGRTVSFEEKIGRCRN